MRPALGVPKNPVNGLQDHHRNVYQLRRRYYHARDPPGPDLCAPTADRLQLNQGTPVPMGVVLRDAVREGGIAQLYRGALPELTGGWRAPRKCGYRIRTPKLC